MNFKTEDDVQVANIRRRTRKEMLKKPDEFLSTYVRAEQFVRHHTTLVIVVVVTVAVIAVAGVGVMRYRTGRVVRAASAYSDALRDLRNAGSDARKRQAAVDDLRVVMTTYASLPVATLARYSLAGLLYDAEKFEEAEQAYRAITQSLIPGEQSTWELAQLGEAKSLHAQGKCEAAIPAYRRVVDQPMARAKSEALMGIARCYEQTNDLAAALKTYSEVNEAYPNAPTGVNLNMKIKALKARVAGSQS